MLFQQHGRPIIIRDLELQKFAVPPPKLGEGDLLEQLPMMNNSDMIRQLLDFG